MAALFAKQWGDVLGMNARSLLYIKRSNTPAASRLANHKLDTKRVLQKAGIATPRLYATIPSRSELKTFRWTKLPSSFVVKPNSSSGGGGILVVFGRNKKGNWVKADKTEIFIPELRASVLDILDGRFSKGNIPDVAFFEQRVKVEASLKPYSVQGIPDIRILVYNHVPVMAMLRLPTLESGGRANLQVGGIGVGIDVSLGLTTTAIHHGQIIDTLPGSRLRLSGIRLPFWNEILHMAATTTQACDLKFAGVDIAIDRDDGPMVLEINARPGPKIQIANLTPLRARLRRVEGLTVKTPEKAVRLAKSLFGLDVEEIEDTTGRTVVGVEETITVYDVEGAPHSLKAKVDTGAYRTTIDTALAKQLHLDRPVVDYKDVRGALGEQTRPVINLSFDLRGHTIKTQAFLADRTHMRYDMIVGRRDLRAFLVDPSRRLPQTTA